VGRGSRSQVLMVILFKSSFSSDRVSGLKSVNGTPVKGRDGSVGWKDVLLRCSRMICILLSKKSENA